MGPEELMRELDQSQFKRRTELALITQERAAAAARKVIPASRELTADEKEFVQTMRPLLPPLIARKDVPKLLGGVVSTGSLANADSAGRGPEVAYRIGYRMVAYTAESLLVWIVGHFGVSRLKNLNTL